MRIELVAGEVDADEGSVDVLGVGGGLLLLVLVVVFAEAEIEIEGFVGVDVLLLLIFGIGRFLRLYFLIMFVWRMGDWERSHVRAAWGRLLHCWHNPFPSFDDGLLHPHWPVHTVELVI